MTQTAAVTSIAPRPHRASSDSVTVRECFEQTIDGLREFLENDAMAGKKDAQAFREFEEELRQRLNKVGREILGKVMEASDVDADAIEIDGKLHRRVLKSKQTYITSFGKVSAERWLYKDRREPEAQSVSAMECRLGIIEGLWTPLSAIQASWVVTQMTPQKAEELFKRTGAMTPSKSSLDRLPKHLSERWEANRETYEQALRKAIVVPEGTHSVAVSLDGVMAPIDGGKRRTEVQARAAAEGRQSQGPASYREMGCATLSFCDEKGELISAIRFGRGPEYKKVSLKERLSKDLAYVLAERPDLQLVKIADAGGDNWEYLATLPPGPEILDFYHATEHLSAAIAAAHGDGTTATRHKFEVLRERLLNEENGATSVISSLAYLARKHPRSKKIATTLKYFRKNKHRMRYAEWRAQGFMVGSGVVEAACKTLVAQRLKLSGMRWGTAGAQAILTMRGWDQSERFDQAWALVAATYQREVHVLANIIDITQHRPK